ncbi:UDP-N-acetylmuramate dehydrogenase [Methyloversatilis sp.]|uniref:UDP-N-acetylmuramate dehydrogenase n=1 Tax=Methyloversatilis sp. TaxID=2569862 RepID=UPI002737312C|nr:UDP-N-acetylmuramate dehydrogenase [Methyloversatilis sp.]MDP2868380.1 UDP-N-acetylmuramate dehydrogenase [Methyloversatilis sp.]MDP3454640.1 UDP-N-acetylmuramate dehydrogenase [Methyloversatilis sp.]MDP3579082.1 UDP-N-acetylmuramate dehydrogenase [Methyloversatilis sp.]
MIQPLQTDADLRNLNTLHLPARAARLQPVDDAADLPVLTDAALDVGGPVLVLGGGSNIVFGRDVDGTVLHMRTRGIDVLGRTGNDVLVSVAAGENWHDWVAHALAQGWHGLENLALIPGTVGAAPVQNIGAYGVELIDYLDHVDAWDMTDRRWLRLGADECRAGYRDSVFKRELAGRAVITRVAFRLGTRPEVRCDYADLQRELSSRGVTQVTPQHVFDAVCAVRRAKLPDPAVLGNAGSFFRNPVLPADAAATLLAAHPDAPHHPAADGAVKFAAAWLIDHCGWKGVRRGEAGVHDRQALVLVNHGEASATDLLDLAADIRASVHARFGVTLEPEPLILR